MKSVSEYVSDNATQWAADAHQFEPGKIHVIARERDKTLCGHKLADCPGTRTNTAANCKTCIKSLESEKRNKEYGLRREEYLRDQRREREEWWRKYNAYLLSAQWKAKSRAVIRRADGICEGCLSRPATQAHHVTYRHVFNELLWELRAVCSKCHDFIHSTGEATDETQF